MAESSAGFLIFPNGYLWATESVSNDFNRRLVSPVTIRQMKTQRERERECFPTARARALLATAIGASSLFYRNINVFLI